jgi:hypothetical protein
MKILALEREVEGAAPGQFQAYLAEEAARAYELYELGIFRELYFNSDLHTAVLVLECRDVVEARGVIDSLPLVRAGLIAFDLIPLAPYSGFARLFSK